jgi:acetyl-CoA synthetase
MGTAEIESALVAHPQVAESAVVGYPHDIKGQGIYAYVTLIEGVEASDELRADCASGPARRSARSPHRTFCNGHQQLPKTRSGKIMRRILRKIAANDYAELGDTSTLTDPGVVTDLVDNRQNR